LKTEIAVLAVVFAILPALFLSGAETTKVGFEILNDDAPIEQGDTLIFKLSDASSAKKSSVFIFGKHYYFNEKGVAFIGSSIVQPSGEYTAVLLDLTSESESWWFQFFCRCCNCRKLEVLPGQFKNRPAANKFNPTEKQKDRRIREGEMFQAAYASVSSAENLISGKFVSPLSNKNIGSLAITDPFGIWRIYSRAKNDQEQHRGVDLRTGKNVPVVSINSGVVIMAENDFLREGNVIVVYHGLGIFSLYAHLSEIKTAKGEKVAAGQVIGLSGATGNETITGPHLHFAVKIHDAVVNPLKFIETANKYLE